MPIDYDEKRDFIRMAADHPLEFHEIGSRHTQQGTCKNLSATGIQFSAERAIASGTRLAVNINPSYAVVRPFNAEVEVLRADAEGAGFRIAAKIIRIDAG